MKKPQLNFNGEAYELIVIQVLARGADGRPTEARFMFDDQRVKLEGGEEFVTAFVPAFITKKRS